MLDAPELPIGMLAEGRQMEQHVRGVPRRAPLVVRAEESEVSGRMFWPSIVVLVVGLFMLVAGIGPLWLPILVVLLGAVGAVMSRRTLRQERS